MSLAFFHDNIVLFSMAFIFGAAGALFVHRYAYTLKLIDVPNHRSSHTTPTPKSGGIGIVVAFVVVCASSDISWSLWIPATILSIFSLHGDRDDIPPIYRLFLQFGAAFFLCYGMRQYSPLFVDNRSTWWWNPEVKTGFLLAASIFVVGTANFYNFMDGINGIAAITGIVGFSLLGAINMTQGNMPKASIVCFALAFSCTGFLPFNIPKAKVFMGDVGSILLGFVFATFALLLAANISQFILHTSFLFPFYADELLTMIERFRSGQKLNLPHRRHLYQVLANEARISHWKISCVYGVVQSVVGIISWQAKERLGTTGMGAFLIVACAAFVIVNCKIKNYFLKNLKKPHKADSLQVEAVFYSKQM